MQRTVVLLLALVFAAPAPSAVAQLAFTVEVPDTAGSTGWGTWIAIDAQDNPRISYGSAAGIAYASRGGAGWTIETVGPGGAETSLALTSLDEPRICYAGNSLMYARRSGSTWTVETVSSSGFTYPSLVLDSANDPHIISVVMEGLRHDYFSTSSQEWSRRSSTPSLAPVPFCTRLSITAR